MKIDPKNVESVNYKLFWKIDQIGPSALRFVDFDLLDGRSASKEAPWSAASKLLLWEPILTFFGSIFIRIYSKHDFNH